MAFDRPDRVEGIGVFIGGDREKASDRESFRRSPRNLRRADDRRVVRSIDEVASGISVGRRPDATGVVVSRTVAPQQVVPFGEERPSLGEKIS